MGMTLEDCVKGVKDDWGNQVKMGCLPRHWRDRRSTYQLSLDNAGWWVDVEHPDSIAALGVLRRDVVDMWGLKTRRTSGLSGAV